MRRGGRTYYPPIGAVFPDVLEETDKFPTELSRGGVRIRTTEYSGQYHGSRCGGMVYNILALGESTVRQATFSTRTVHIRPELQKTRRKAA